MAYTARRGDLDRWSATRLLFYVVLMLPISSLAPAQTATVSPKSVNFAAQLLGTNSPPVIVSLGNPSTVPFNITGIQATGDYAQTNNCPWNQMLDQHHFCAFGDRKPTGNAQRF